MIMKCKLLFLFINLFIFETIKYLYHRDINKSFINFVETLAKFNIFYIKLFQSIGTNTKIFNSVQREYLLKYLDNVPYVSSNIEYQIIHDIIQVGKKNSNLILDTYKLKIINSGIIAIVYKTTMLNKDVVIKIKRKNIDTMVYAAVDEVEFIIYLLSFIPSLKYFYLKDLFFECKLLLLNQLDFNMEICNFKNFYNNNSNTDYIKIPYVYDKFTLKNENIIVMEYLPGCKFCNLQENDKIDYSKLIAKFSLKSLFFDRVFHADLHGGNIIFMKENNNKKLGIIDFGIIGSITREEQNIYYKFINEIFINNNYKNAATIILEQITIPINNDIYIVVDSKCSDQIEDIMEKKINCENDIDFYNCYKLNIILGKYNLKLSPYFCKLQYSIGTSCSLFLNLSNNEPFFNNISEMCKNLLEYI